MYLTLESMNMCRRMFYGLNFNSLNEKIQDYLVMKMNLIENESTTTEYEAIKWSKLDLLASATIQIKLSELVNFTLHLCTTT